MFLGKAFRQESVVNRACERYVYHAIVMHVAHFGVSEPKFLASKAMQTNGYFRPPSDFLFDCPLPIFDART